MILRTIMGDTTAAQICCSQDSGLFPSHAIPESYLRALMLNAKVRHNEKFAIQTPKLRQESAQFRRDLKTERFLCDAVHGHGGTDCQGTVVSPVGRTR